jgi:hypothetical protein
MPASVEPLRASVEPLQAVVVPASPVDDVAAAALRRLSSIDSEAESTASAPRVRLRVFVGVVCAIAASIVIGAGLVDVRRGEPSGGSGSTTSAAGASDTSGTSGGSGAQVSAGDAPEPSAAGSATPAMNARSLAGDSADGSVQSLPKARLRAAAQASAPHLPTRQLHWTPVQDAGGYSIELYRGPKQVFVARSRNAHFALPAAWTRHGTSYRRDPQDLLFVWPLVRGRRAAKPVIDGRLVFDLYPGALSSKAPSEDS